jgi:hypothetical protein
LQKGCCRIELGTSGTRSENHASTEGSQLLALLAKHLATCYTYLGQRDTWASVQTARPGLKWVRQVAMRACLCFMCLPLHRVKTTDACQRWLLRPI